MKWIGLTGGIGCGKTTVARFLRQYGITILDADEVVHLILSGSEPRFTNVIENLVQVFGRDILQKDGGIDRPALGRLVFSDPQKLAKLESILHPEVKREVARRRAELAKSGCPLAIYDVPLLFEKGMQNQFDAIIVVTCSSELQVRRLRERSGWGDEEIAARIRTQLPLAEKEKGATVVISNNGTLAELEEQVANLCRKLGAQLNTRKT